MQCMVCTGKPWFMMLCVSGTYESWVRSAAWRFSLCVSRSIRSEPWSVVRELGEGTDTHRAGRQVQMSTPVRDTCSYSAIKMPFFFFFFEREILTQFIPTHGSLHTSKSYGCLNGSMYTHADRHTRHTHKQTHKEPCQGRRDQLPLQAW